MSGSAWTTLIDYQAFTNDSIYQADIHTALAANLGPNFSLMPSEQAGWEANDDQAYWVYAVLAAMEYEFPALECKKLPSSTTVDDCANSWQAVAVNAFDQFVARWKKDSSTCGGGLKWQYNPDNNGYDYKNSVSNGGFFQTAARLARYTGDRKYADWANRVWDWSRHVGFISPELNIFDGAGDAENANCSAVNPDQWTYNMATYMHGAAHMYAYSKQRGVDGPWEARVKGMVQTAERTFFGPEPHSPGVMYEQRCEKSGSCTTDQTSFKASLARWMAKTAMLVPSVRPKILGLLETTAKGAAASCSGQGKNACGMKWYTNNFDGQADFGTQLSALEAVQSLLVTKAPPLASLASQSPPQEKCTSRSTSAASS